MEVKNIFQSQIISSTINDEIFETILKKDNIIIERIISAGQVTPNDSWYNQEKCEWVILLQGEAILEFENAEIIKMKSGNYIYIPAHIKHRVCNTSKTPHCIWLAIHFQ